MKNPIKLHDGIALGLFQMADTLGFPLADSILECRKFGYAPGLPSFVCDAVLAEWKPEKAINQVRVAFADLGETLPVIVEKGLAIAAQQPDRWSSAQVAAGCLA